VGFAVEDAITLVRQSAKCGRVPDVLTVAELRKLLSELKKPWRTAIFVASTTGLRVSELLALKWQDFDFTSGHQLNLCRGIVRQNIGGMKSEASRKPLPLDAGLAEVLLAWRRICPFNQDADYVFGSLEKKGQQPYWPTGMEDHVRPAAKRAGITKRIGWHTLRHTFGTLVKSQGADVATTKELMRHANVSITMDRYVQAIGEQKRQAQHSVVGLLAPNGPTALTIPPASC
jgi:integrase